MNTRIVSSANAVKLLNVCAAIGQADYDGPETGVPANVQANVEVVPPRLRIVAIRGKTSANGADSFLQIWEGTETSGSPVATFSIYDDNSYERNLSGLEVDTPVIRFSAARLTFSDTHTGTIEVEYEAFN